VRGRSPGKKLQGGNLRGRSPGEITGEITGGKSPGEFAYRPIA